jgi:hypothetical protein
MIALSPLLGASAFSAASSQQSTLLLFSILLGRVRTTNRKHAHAFKRFIQMRAQ